MVEEEKISSPIPQGIITTYVRTQGKPPELFNFSSHLSYFIIIYVLWGRERDFDIIYCKKCTEHIVFISGD